MTRRARTESENAIAGRYRKGTLAASCGAVLTKDGTDRHDPVVKIRRVRSYAYQMWLHGSFEWGESTDWHGEPLPCSGCGQLFDLALEENYIYASVWRTDEGLSVLCPRCAKLVGPIMCFSTPEEALAQAKLLSDRYSRGDVSLVHSLDEYMRSLAESPSELIIALAHLCGLRFPAVSTSIVNVLCQVRHWIARTPPRKRKLTISLDTEGESDGPDNASDS